MKILQALFDDETIRYAKKITILSVAAGVISGCVLWLNSVVIVRPIKESRDGEARDRIEAIKTLASHMDTVLAIQGAELKQIKLANQAILEISAGGGVYSKPQINRIVEQTNERIDAIETDITIMKARLTRAHIR